MPRTGITVYDLLISCPGDVEEYIPIIEECIDGFNSFLGKVNDIEVNSVHWSTDGYPQSGDNPQALLNKQIVEKCDAAIAIFWTRFGTPTEKYGSGTEEEVEVMLAAAKQVFMYFVDEPISISEVDIEQYERVKSFREKYKDKGIYWVIKDKEEFKRLFTNHLHGYFMSLITEEASTPSKKEKESKLSIIDYYNLKS